MRGRFPSSTKNELASKPIAAPVSAVARSSTIEREHRALGPAHRKHRSVERGRGVRRRIPVAVERPAGRDRLALLRGDHHLAARDLGERQVDERAPARRREETRRRSGSCRGAGAARPRPPSPPASCRWRARRGRPLRPARGDTPRRRSDGCSSRPHTRRRARARGGSPRPPRAHTPETRARTSHRPAQRHPSRGRSRAARTRRRGRSRDAARTGGRATHRARQARAPPRRRARRQWSRPSRDSHRRARAHAWRGPAARRARRAACG